MPKVSVESVLKTYPDQASLVRLACGHERIVTGPDVATARHWCEICEVPKALGSAKFWAKENSLWKAGD